MALLRHGFVLCIYFLQFVCANHTYAQNHTQTPTKAFEFQNETRVEESCPEALLYQIKKQDLKAGGSKLSEWLGLNFSGIDMSRGCRFLLTKTFPTPQDLESFFLSQNEINLGRRGSQPFVSQCMARAKLSTDQQYAALTEYYYTMNRVSRSAQAQLGVITFADRMLGLPPLKDTEIPYDKNLPGSRQYYWDTRNNPDCQKSAKEDFNAMVQDTQKALFKLSAIEAEEKLYQGSRTQRALPPNPQRLAQLKKAREAILRTVYWLESPNFSNLIGKRYIHPRSGTKDQWSAEYLSERLSNHLRELKSGAQNEIKQLSSVASCLHSSAADVDCIAQTAPHLLKTLPMNMEQLFSKPEKSASDSDLKKYQAALALGAGECRAKNREEKAKANQVASDAIVQTVLTVATAGAGHVYHASKAAMGAAAAGAATKLPVAVQMARGFTLGADTAWLGVSGQDALNECNKIIQTTLAFNQHNQHSSPTTSCQSSMSASNPVFADRSCTLSAIMAAVDGLPFVPDGVAKAVIGGSKASLKAADKIEDVVHDVVQQSPEPGGTLFLRKVEGKDGQARIEVLRHEVQAGQLSAAEARSLDHQQDVIRSIDTSPGAARILNDAENLKHSGLHKEEYLRAVAAGIDDSDFGKRTQGVELFLKESADSNLLLNVLSGKKFQEGTDGFASQKALRELLDEAGFSGKWLLNQNLSANEIRQAANEARVLTGFLHEFPGMVNAIKDYEKALKLAPNAASRARVTSFFKERIKANLFHNGPESGFWSRITTLFVPGALSKAPTNSTKSFFDGTVFKSVDGKLQYPGPLNSAGVVHATADRLSQGTGGGMLKIYDEIAGFTAPTEIVRQMVWDNPTGTIEQLKHLAQIANNTPHVSAGTREMMTRNVALAATRVADFQSTIQQRIKKVFNADGSVDATKIEIDGVVYSNEQKAEVHAAFIKVVEETEVQLKPMAPFPELAPHNNPGRFDPSSHTFDPRSQSVVVDSNVGIASTPEAREIGIEARTLPKDKFDAFVAEMDKKIEEFNGKAEAITLDNPATMEANFNARMQLSTQAQFYREAKEAATNTGSYAFAEKRGKVSPQSAAPLREYPVDIRQTLKRSETELRDMPRAERDRVLDWVSRLSSEKRQELMKDVLLRDLRKRHQLAQTQKLTMPSDSQLQNMAASLQTIRSPNSAKPYYTYTANELLEKRNAMLAVLKKEGIPDKVAKELVEKYLRLGLLD